MISFNFFLRNSSKSKEGKAFIAMNLKEIIYPQTFKKTIDEPSGSD